MSTNSLLLRLPDGLFWTENKDSHKEGSMGGKQIMPGKQLFKLGIRKQRPQNRENGINEYRPCYNNSEY